LIGGGSGNIPGCVACVDAMVLVGLDTGDLRPSSALRENCSVEILRTVFSNLLLGAEDGVEGVNVGRDNAERPESGSLPLVVVACCAGLG